MQAVLFTIAEYASISNEGKLSVHSIFDSIVAEAFPAHAPRVYLVAQFRADAAEYGAVFDVRFRLYDPAETPILDLSGAGEVPHNDPALTVLMNQVVLLENLAFAAPGLYHFVADVDGEQAAVLPFHVVQSPAQEP